MDNPESSPREQPCPACQGGVLRLQYQTHFVWLRTEMITVPDFPVWVCDLCHYRQNDVRALRWLGMLLSPHLGKRVTKRPQGRAARTRRAQQRSQNP
ncbi:MAG: YgiT-type zinc finger protein [Anaerolineae bacterium]|nr:MAG: YgiT-type zinc finger protein [Anaerolineae bacterium]